MMWLLTSANDAILVILTFMLQLEFDSNLPRYKLRLWWVEANGKYFFSAHDCNEYQMYIKGWKPYGFYSTRTDLSSVWRYVYIITFI